MFPFPFLWWISPENNNQYVVIHHTITISARTAEFSSPSWSELQTHAGAGCGKRTPIGNRSLCRGQWCTEIPCGMAVQHSTCKNWGWYLQNPAKMGSNSANLGLWSVFKHFLWWSVASQKERKHSQMILSLSRSWNQFDDDNLPIFRYTLGPYSWPYIEDYWSTISFPRFHRNHHQFGPSSLGAAHSQCQETV